MNLKTFIKDHICTGFSDSQKPREGSQLSTPTTGSREYQNRADPSLLTVFSQGSPGKNMQRDANEVQSLRSTEETNIRRSRQEGQRSSDSFDSPWNEHEIWIFLQEWEVVEYEMGHQVEIEKKAKSLSRRLNTRGLGKSWNSCLQLMLSMMDLHRTLCNERPRSEPLFSPYAWELYKILGHRGQAGALYDWSCNTMVSMYPQPPMMILFPVQQPWDSAASIPSGQLHGNPSLM